MSEREPVTLAGKGRSSDEHIPYHFAHGKRFISGVLELVAKSQYQQPRNVYKKFHFSPPGRYMTRKVCHHLYEEAQPCRIWYPQRGPILAQQKRQVA
jgi:hypothetical protein